MTTTAGLSRDRLSRLHAVMAGHVARGVAPGLVALVSRRGETDVNAAGVTALGGREPMRRNTIFRVASITKPITAAAAMMLIEECKIRLDDPVDELLPELANRQVLTRPDGPLDDTVPAKRPITVRDLLTFRLGLGLTDEPEPSPIAQTMDELLVGFVPNPRLIPAPDEWMRRLGSLPLMAQPGERWLYNTGSDVLGVLIARASGRDLETFLRERIFAPLGMQDTAFSVPASKRDRLASAYWTNPETGALELFDDAGDTFWSQPPAFFSGGAGLVSTVDDYLAFGQMILAGGRSGDARILSRPSVALMTTDHLTPDQKALGGLVPGYWDGHGWGFGGAIGTRRESVGETPGKFGWDGGFGTSWYVDPAEEMVTILFTQAAFTSPVVPPVVRDFWTAAYQTIAD